MTGEALHQIGEARAEVLAGLHHALDQRFVLDDLEHRTGSRARQRIAAKR
jgi:hypothetical protein